MSQLLDTGLSDAESEAGGSESAEYSLSRYSSSSSSVTTDLNPEKNREGSTSLETGWTDSKHSSYLDYMEATFVQNMYARSYCMEDVCGGTAYHQHHHHQHQYQHDGDTHSEETGDSMTESCPHLQAAEWEMQNCSKWSWSPALKANAIAGVPRHLLANPWYKRFRTRNLPTFSIKTNDGMVKGNGKCQQPTSLVMNNVNPCQLTSDSLSGVENKPAATFGTIVLLKGTEGSFLNVPSSDPLDRTSRNKRRILWSMYKQLRRTRQRTDS